LKLTPPIQKRLGQLQVFGIGVEILGHLGGQFARRAQHEAARHAGPGPAARQHRQHRQGEAGGLSGAGLRDAQNVAPGEGGRNRRRLNRRGGVVARLFDGLENLGIEVEIRKLCHAYPSFTDTIRPVRLSPGQTPPGPVVRHMDDPRRDV